MNLRLGPLLALVALAQLRCVTTQTLNREEVVKLAVEPVGDRPFASDAPLRLQTDRGHLGPQPVGTLQADGAYLRFDDASLLPEEVQFAEVTSTSKAKTAGLVAGVTVGALTVTGTVLLIVTAVALSSIHLNGL